MSDDNVYPVPQSHMADAEKFDYLLRKYEKDAEELRDEFNNQMARLNDACKLEARDVWFEVAKAAGLDAIDTWNNPEYFLDRRYIEYGFAAICHVPQQEHPFAGMAGGMADPSEKPAAKRKLH